MYAYIICLYADEEKIICILCIRYNYFVLPYLRFSSVLCVFGDV